MPLYTGSLSSCRRVCRTCIFFDFEMPDKKPCKDCKVNGGMDDFYEHA